jgi:hypothetical protein
MIGFVGKDEGVGVVEPRNMCEGVNVIFSLEFFLRNHETPKMEGIKERKSNNTTFHFFFWMQNTQTNAAPIVVNISNNHFH